MSNYPLDDPRSTWPVADIAEAWRRELPGADTDSIAVITPLWRTAKALADDRRRTLAVIGIDPATLDLLSVIRRAGPPYELTTREITERTLVTAGAISQRIARAEEAGLVERAPSNASRRAVAVRLTDAGHRLIEDAVQRLLAHESRVVAALTDQEQSVLATCLAKIDAALA
ncbi:MarR family winged helix-turn-helix transcriptional regulator [Kutzneria chonburiensis]|uniref:MarR family winged helix-turn-helix transcriptional regulator n=1 Tax=Kutzneria chonburiensis TaxID=1483604 RepID=A0ABV6N1C5_9PSEU|nr:MarR family transcriptional regulator [Kutzneria chonburiensis]